MLTFHCIPGPFLLLIALLLCSVTLSVRASDADSSSDDPSVISGMSEDVMAIFTGSDSITLGTSVSAAIAIGLGLVVCFLGYRLLRPTMFVCGFLAGALAVGTLIEKNFADESWEPTGVWVGFVLGGFVSGVLVVMIYTAGIFLIGCVAGVLLAIALNTSFAYKIYPSEPLLVLVVLMIILGLLGGMLALKLERPIIIVATSLVGAALTVTGVGYYGKDFPNTTDLKKYLTEDAETGDWVYSIPSAWWAYLSVMGALFILGMLTQFFKTAGRSRTLAGEEPTTRRKAYLLA